MASLMTPAPKPVLSDVSRATERHYSVEEVADLWKLSPSAVRRLFQHEPGVLTIGEPRPKFGRRRGKVTMRIPQSVLDRVHQRRCIVGYDGH
jgi:hypothetical protein